MKRKTIAAVLAISMAAALLGGCGGTGETGSAASETNAKGTEQGAAESKGSEAGASDSKDTDDGASNSSDTKDAASESKTSGSDDIVTLKWYMSINPVAPDTDKVIEKLNEYTRDKIGVEIDYQVIANPDYKEKMPTYINSGEYFDICFTANWTTNYAQFATRDAFMDITELLPQYAKETYDFIPQEEWDAVKVDGKIYGVPSYKEMGWQGSIYANSDMAKEYGIDLSKVKTLNDYTEVLKTVKEKSQAEGKNVIGLSGLNSGFQLGVPFESLTGTPTLPGASAIPETNLFADQEEVFNQYATPEYMEYCKMIHGWYQNGYISKDPVQYDSDIANRDNDFNNGNLFSYVTANAPGAAQMLETTAGHGITSIDLTMPIFETRSALGGLLAISSGSEHPEKALEFINLLNTDQYVGTLIRHGIEGEHYTAVGDNQIDRTMGGTLSPDKNGYDYTFGWQFGTPFNQKWDISYPENIVELFEEYNGKSITAKHNGFMVDTTTVETVIASVTNVVAQYGPALESGMVDPEEKIPEFLKQLEENGVDELLNEISSQIKDHK